MCMLHCASKELEVKLCPVFIHLISVTDQIHTADADLHLFVCVLMLSRRLDYVVNNAGGQFLSSAEDISANGFEAVVKTNLTGTFLMCREAYNQWMCEHGGSIVNITVANSNGYPGMAHR
jgi:peroxisomal trans-2-enoyl-CoA reductase